MTTQFANVYGGALYSLACEEGLEAVIGEELAQVNRLLKAEPKALKLLDSPLVPREERCGCVQRMFGGQVQPYLVNFLKLLCRRGQMSQLAGCAAHYHALYNEAHNISDAVAVTALPLSPDQTARLKAQLEKVTGKTILLENRVDPAVLGGVRVEVDGKRLDGTVKNRLDGLRRAIGGAVL